MRLDAPPRLNTTDLARSLESGYTLPADWYTDPTMYAREQARIFHRSWQYVGLAEQVAHPGDFFTCALGAIPIVVVRDEAGQLRAFANVCRHRGSQLVLDACGSRKTLQCHYHAWTYNLDGSLRAAPGSKAEPDFNQDEYPLWSVQLDTWGPFMFVNLDPAAPPLASVLGALPQMVAATGVDLDAVKRRVRREYEIAANWKVVVDNYLECYHCPVAHPAFSDLIDLDNYQVTGYEYFSTQSGPKKANAGASNSHLYDASLGVQEGFYAYLWPNFTLNIYPGPGNISLNLILPLDTHRTLLNNEYCFVDAVTDEQAQDFVRFIHQVQEEDTVLCESVQRGLRSGFFQQGKLLLSRENGLQHFQKLIYRFLAPPDSAAITQER
jgi:phenylpropionate dioxygenase-like ring-hydroxylating dioxygenase large terminal subunit